MIIHSIVPLEVIFQNNFSVDIPKTSYVRYMGELVEAVSDGDAGYTINRIISTSPKAYLNPELQPGSKILSFTDKS